MPAIYRRVVITGLGLLTPLGSDLETVWADLLAGKSGIRRVTQFSPDGLPCQIAGEIPDYKPEDHFPAKEVRRLSRASQVAMVAARKAVADSRLPLPLVKPERVGVYFGTAIGGLERADEGMQVLPGYSKVVLVLRCPTCRPSVTQNSAGLNSTITTACATGPTV
jgi:3-oxoacyl-[acyl-carrier-protein] synthase II